jgi:hypothetical protein
MSSRVRGALLLAGILVPLAFLWGCSGVVSGQSIQTPPPQAYSISGTISPAAAGGGATVTLSGAANSTTTANSSGNFTFTGLANGTYTVTPSHTGYTFNPSSLSVTVSGANITTGLNFTSTALTFSISGTISPATGGSGATVTLGGAAAATTTTSSSGSYTFTGLADGIYSVAPSNTGYTFSPGSQNVTISGSNVAGVNFTATAQVAHSATLSWIASTSSVAGYNIYRSSVSGGPYTKMNSSLITLLTYTDTAVLAGLTYYYLATSVNASNVESSYSNEISATIPTP